MEYSVRMESPQEFSSRASRLLAKAQALSFHQGESNAVLNGWMMEAKRRRMTWVDGLDFAIDRMQDSADRADEWPHDPGEEA